MALLFSKVILFDGETEAEFLVGGIPRDYDDLEGYTAFDDYLGELTSECDIEVHVDSYLYGEGESVKATPEEVAYMMKRIEMRADFLEARCDNIEDSTFLLRYSPEELFGMEME